MMFRTNRLYIWVLMTLAGLTGCAPQRWKLGMQVYTLRTVSFFEALDKCKALGIKYIEAYPGQRLSPEHKRIQLRPNLPAKYRKMIKKKLAENGQVLSLYGVIGLSKDEAKSREVFEFAKDMGIKTIVSEPEPGSFKLLDKLTAEYGINVAIHNHPQPSRYWNPDAVLKAVEGCSKRIGACADTGHWMRSGIDPLEALKKLRGRIVSLHFKDLNKMGRGGEHDVPWGTGKGNARALLEELKRQGFTGVFSIEYEQNANMTDLGKCVAWFNKTTAELYGK